MDKEIVNSVGIEFETEDLQTKVVEAAIRRSGLRYWQLTSDASIVSDVRLVPGLELPVEGIPSRIRTPESNQTQRGIEIISTPFNTTQIDLLAELKRFTNMLQNLGESAEGFRSGIHLHIMLPDSLGVLKSTLRLGRYLEDVFFYLGGQGYMFRGMKVNESLYCRPITGNGPTVVSCGSKAFQIFNLPDLLSSTTKAEFWTRYCDTAGKSISHGFPGRYVWLNVYSFLHHGTLEFRVFNKTLNPFYIWAEVLLCQHFASQCLLNSFQTLRDKKMLEEHSIFTTRDKGSIIDTLDRFLTETDFDNAEVKEILFEIIKRTPQVTLPNRLLWCHSNQQRSDYWSNSSYSPPEINPKSVNRVVVDDIHSRRGER